MSGLMRHLILLLICSVGFIFAAPPQVQAEDTNNIAIEDEESRQLRICRDALTHGVTERIRLDAAMGLLMRKDQASHAILLDVLTASDNLPAQIAVCQALIKGRGIGSAVGSVEMFLPPLIEVVRSSDISLARLAAEALLLFPFDRISPAFTELAENPKADKQARLNVIYVFQIRPESQSLGVLVGLLDDSDPQIVRAAELALQESFGMPIGTGKNVWQKVLNELKEKKPDEINRERLLRQENRLREVQIQRDLWRKLYLDTLDKEFESLDVKIKSTYLQDKLGSDLPEVKLWALDKVQRISSESAALFREKLLVLLSDDNRDVRLGTAKALSTMSALDPGQVLLEQYQKENDPQVALAIFEALGEACFFAFSPGSKITLPMETKAKTLQIAKEYTSKDDPEMSKKGAEVLQKLLELNGLTPKETQYYLETILSRYHLETQNQGPIRGELLAVMARLCGSPQSRTDAALIFRPVFESALRSHDDNSMVRQAAAIGMVNIDKIAAMQLFQEIGLQNDSSPAVLQVYIELAGQTGTADDLDWLVGLFAANGQGDHVWSAMLSILQRQDAGVIASWALKLEQNTAFSDEIRELLSIAEQKAATQDDADLLYELQFRLIMWYGNQKNFDQVAVYREKLSAADTSNPKVYKALRQTDELAVEAYLQIRNFASAAGIIGDLLRQNQISSTSTILDRISIYLESGANSIADKKSLLKSLSELTISSEQLWWNEKLECWKSFEGNGVKGDPNNAAVRKGQ